MKTKVITIVAEFPPGTSNADVESYVRDAIGSWGGGYRPPGSYGPDDPGDDFFNGITPKKMKVVNFRSPNLYPRRKNATKDT